MICRVVLDTSVLVAALRSSRGASFALLVLLQRRAIVAVASPAIFLEYEDVLKRPEQRLAHKPTPEETDGLLKELAETMEHVRIYYRWRPQLQDVGDEIVLEAALNGRADTIVTHNTRDFRAAERLFGVRVLSPSDVLKEVNK